MTLLEQTLITLLCMVATWWWGITLGTRRGIEIAVDYMENNGLLKDNVTITFDEEDEDE